MSQDIENNNYALTVLPPKIDLHTPTAVRRELASVYRSMRSESIEGQQGTKLAYVLNMLLRAHEVCDLEKKIDAVKRELDKR